MGKRGTVSEVVGPFIFPFLLPGYLPTIRTYMGILRAVGQLGTFSPRVVLLRCARAWKVGDSLAEAPIPATMILVAYDYVARLPFNRIGKAVTGWKNLQCRQQMQVTKPQIQHQRTKRRAHFLV